MNTLKKELRKAAESNYKQFSKKITPTDSEILGIRLPWLRKKAKELAKKGTAALALIDTEYFEERMLRGLVIANIKTDINTKLDLIFGFLPMIDNWAVCDSFCASLKDAKEYPEEIWQFIKCMTASENEFHVRFAVVMMLDHYIKEEYIDEILDILSKIKHTGYYVRMAIAWILSVCCVKFRDKTVRYFRMNALDDFTHNKAIQKCRESLRISKEDKAMLAELKR